MNARIQIDQLQPQAYKAMYTLEAYLANCDLSKSHKELIKIRASQINGCAFCINMHTQDALKMGETEQRIFLLNAWEESGLFNEKERTILSMTEEITLIHKNGLSEQTYNAAISLFGESYTAQIIMAISIINSWNRIAISTHKPIS